MNGQTCETLRISKWNPTISLSCRICQSSVDSQVHLFGECYYVKELWTLVFSFLATPISFAGLEDQIQFMITISKKKTPVTRVIIRCWTELVYEVWHQRNLHTFEGRLDRPATAARSILFRVACRSKGDDIDCMI